MRSLYLHICEDEWLGSKLEHYMWQTRDGSNLSIFVDVFCAEEMYICTSYMYNLTGCMQHELRLPIDLESFCALFTVLLQ